MEKFIEEPARKTLVAEEVDVLVLGAGPAGVGAAFAAARNGFNFDIHNVKGPGLDEHGVQENFHSKGVYTIPLRACIPVRIKSPALAGRNISGTHLAHSNYRVMTICLNMGYGVGTAAAIALRDGVQIRDVDIVKVQKRLNEDGVVL